SEARLFLFGDGQRRRDAAAPGAAAFLRDGPDKLLAGRRTGGQLEAAPAGVRPVLAPGPGTLEVPLVGDEVLLVVVPVALEAEDMALAVRVHPVFLEPGIAGHVAGPAGGVVLCALCRVGDSGDGEPGRGGQEKGGEGPDGQKSAAC